MQNSAITLLSLNMHQDYHLETVTALITERATDVICLQETQKIFVEDIARRLGYDFLFSLRTYNASRDDGAELREEGVALIWHPSLRLRDSSVIAYREKDQPVVKRLTDDPNDVRRTMLVATLLRGVQVFRIGTTHFTWTPDGSASEEQCGDMHRMLSALEVFHDEYGIVFCGDFNAPRGGEILKMMSDVYTDNLPRSIVTTLDQALHRAAPIFHAVDSIFCTKEYAVSDVAVVDGVSDHMALFAKVSKSVC